MLKKIKLSDISEEDDDHDIEMKEVEDLEEEEQIFGKGYIGSTKSDEDQEPSEMNNSELDRKISDVRKDFEIMKQEVEQMKTLFAQQHKKEITALKSEVHSLKEEYRKCLEELKNETYARNEAETVIKVLKETIEARKHRVD